MQTCFDHFPGALSCCPLLFLTCSNFSPSTLIIICRFFLSYHLGTELLRSDSVGDDILLKHLWHHPDAILCCSLKVGDPAYPFHVVILPRIISLCSQDSFIYYFSIYVLSIFSVHKFYINQLVVNNRIWMYAA